MGESKLLKMIVILLVILMLFTTGCAGKPDGSIEISLRDMQTVDNEKQPTNPNTLRVAFSSITSPKETMIYYSDLLKYIEKNSGLTIKVIQRKTYKEVNDLIEAGEVDLAFICTYAYILGTEKFGLQPFLVPQINGKTTYQSYIIVPKDSTVSTFEELKDKRFAFTDPLSNTGYIYPRYLIKQENQTTDTFFKKSIFTYSHDNSTKAVYDKIVDGAAVDSLVYDYLIEQKPEFGDKIRIINISEEFGMPPIVVSSGVNSETRKKIKDIFLNMHESAEGEAILQHLKIERFREQEDANYDSVRKIAEEVLNEE